MSKVLDIEHSIYCITNCRVELPFHKQYYRWCKNRYDIYVASFGTWIHE